MVKFARRVSFANDVKEHDGVILPLNSWTYYHVVCGFLGVKRVFGENVNPIKTVNDIVRITNFDLDMLKYCMRELTMLRDMLVCLEREEYVRQQLRDVKNYLERDPEWERVCERSICMDRFCCIDKKLSRRRKGIALVRDGYRGCNIAFITESIPRIHKLMRMIHSAIVDAKFELNVDYDYIKAPKKMEIEDDYVLL